MPTLSAGRLRHRVTIERQVIMFNSAHEQTPEWEMFATVWAAIEPLSVREAMIAAQVQSRVSARIVIRQLIGLLPSMRVVHNGVVYAIEGIVPDPDSGLEYQNLAVSTGVSEG